MISQATGHGRSTSPSPLLGLTQLVMRHTEIVRAANQVHSCVQSLHARSCVPTLARQARQSLADGSIQPFNTSRLEYVSPTRELEQRLGLIKQTVSQSFG